MPTVQSGARGTIGFLTDLIAQNMVKKSVQLNPSAGPLTTFLSVLDKFLETETPEPQHTEDELLPNRDTFSAANTDTTDTTLAVNNPGYYLVGDILHVPRTQENMRVTVADGTSPITVVRGVGSAPANIALDDPIWILGGAQREGDNSRQALNTLEVPKTEYCQVVRNSVYMTEVGMGTRVLGGDFEDLFDKKVIEHKRQIDSLMKFSSAGTVTSVSSQNLRTMQGLNNWIDTNRFAVDGVLGEGEFDAICDAAGAFGNDRKLAIVSPKVYRAINNFAKNRMETVGGDETYGMNIKSYMNGGLDLWLTVDKELKGATYSGYMFIVDPDYLVVRPLLAYGGAEKYQGTGYMKRVENIQDNDEAARKDEIYSCLTLHKFVERTASAVTGVEG